MHYLLPQVPQKNVTLKPFEQENSKQASKSYIKYQPVHIIDILVLTLRECCVRHFTVCYVPTQIGNSESKNVNLKTLPLEVFILVRQSLEKNKNLFCLIARLGPLLCYQMENNN